MSSDPDSCLPEHLRDFVFDLHQSTRRAQIPAEQSTLYNGTFREISAKYFAQGPWPSPQSVSSECGDDTLFLALYRELTHRHLHSVTRPQLRDRIDGWHVYRNLFDLLLAESSADANVSSTGKDEGRGTFFILPEWAFDILHEFVYQFQGFCQFRTSAFANATTKLSGEAGGDGAAGGAGGDAADAGGASSGGSRKQPPAHVMESLEVLSNNRDAWAVETVLFYLHRLVSIGCSTSSTPSAAYRHLGLFASVTLSRLECLLGDYRASLRAAQAIDAASSVITVADKTRPSVDVLNAVFHARLSLAYHAGVSYLMTRRYKDASRTLSSLCAFMQRGFKTGQLRKLPHSDQFSKQYDRMIALLAILTHVCPLPGLVDDAVMRVVREKHGSQLSKIESGEEGYEDLFIFACPKFVSPAVPEYNQVLGGDVGGSSSVILVQDAYKLQVKQFMNEMAVQQQLRKLRSYMKLYTSIHVSKLAAFNDMHEQEEFLPLLLCYKHKMRQLELASSLTSNGAPLELGEEKGANDEESGVTEVYGCALDTHFFIVQDMIHVEEGEKERRFENYFLAQILQNEEIMRDVEAISTEI